MILQDCNNRENPTRQQEEALAQIRREQEDLRLTLKMSMDTVEDVEKQMRMMVTTVEDVKYQIRTVVHGEDELKKQTTNIDSNVNQMSSKIAILQSQTTKYRQLDEYIAKKRIDEEKMSA